MILLAALLAAAAIWWAVPASASPRLLRIVRPMSAPPPAQHRGVTTIGWLAALSAAMGAWVLVGGIVGVGLAVLSVALIPPGLRRLESRGARQEREALARQAALLADLLAATLAAGATVRDALAVSGEAVGSPTQEALRPVVQAIDLGADPGAAFATAGVPDVHQAIVDALVRAQDSGAPVAVLLGRAAEDLRRERRREVEVAARSAGVRAVAPLAACFLPAFLLVGVVPVVASLAGGLLSG